MKAIISVMIMIIFILLIMGFYLNDKVDQLEIRLASIDTLHVKKLYVDTWGYKKSYTLPPTSGATVATLTKKRAVIFMMKDIADFDVHEINITPIQIVNL